jgi:hypothetical protein
MNLINKNTIDFGPKIDLLQANFFIFFEYLIMFFENSGLQNRHKKIKIFEVWKFWNFTTISHYI